MYDDILLQEVTVESANGTFSERGCSENVCTDEYEKLKCNELSDYDVSCRNQIG